MLNFQPKKLVFLFLMMLFAFTTSAQQDHFVYLQTDNGKPFYVKMNKKILSSSAEGYIIIPNITSGVYQIKVGFPKNEYPEENFTLSVDNNNEGYLIKHVDENGLQLFNIETLALISGSHEIANTAIAKPDSVKKEANPFTQMLANVVKDSSILQNHQVVVENSIKPADSSLALSNIKATTPVDSNKTDSLNLGKNIPVPAIGLKTTDSSVTNTVETSQVSKSVSSQVATKTSPISKLLSMQNEDGWQMMYGDSNENKLDTVLVFMPLDKNKLPANSEPTNNDNFNFTATKKSNNSTTDTSNFTFTSREIKPEKEKSGIVLRNDNVPVQHDSAGKTAPEQVFYIGPKKNENGSATNPSMEKNSLITDVKITGASKKKNEDDQNSGTQLVVLPKVVTSSKVNSDCKAFAENEDFLRLRKKMAAENTKEDMIKVASKFFKSKCYSTEQIKNLSYLFLTDEGKYMFFDAAYAFTSDSDQYPVLESQLKDDYYRNRFIAMIKK